MGIFPERCAPIQINYLGYPGTSGADFIDYIFADKILIPKENQKFFDWRNNRKKQPVSDTQAYRKFGNSVAVPVAKALARAVCEKLKELKAAR